MKTFILTLMVSTIIFGFAATANAQYYQFVVFETAVTREGIEISDQNPPERRFYVSNVVLLPDNIRTYQTPRLVDEYFTVNLVDPLKEKGINHDYYDDDVQIDCGSAIGAKDKQDAEAKRAECLEEIKEHEKVTIYSFNWTFASAKGLQTTNPTLIHRGKDTPNYEPKSE